MNGKAHLDYARIRRTIYLLLPFTLIKQRLFYRLRKPPAGLPGFLCIGTQKSGTTWLHEQLKHHPGVCLAQEKEVHYFDWFFHRPLRWYLSRFNCGGDRVRGELTPGYSVIESGRIRFIRRIMPGVRLILLLRDPRERAWSSARFHFGKALGRELSSVTTEEYLRHFDEAWVRMRGDYEMIWKKWSAVFPKEQLLVLFTETIGQDPAGAMQTVCRFIGVETFLHEATLNSRPNKSEALDMPPEIRAHLDARYKDMIRRMPGILEIANVPWKL